MKTLLMILSMEIGDKTFFIGAILAMSHNKWFVFLGSVSALVVMCIISCVIGVTAPILMSRDLTVVVAAVLVSVCPWHYNVVCLFWHSNDYRGIQKRQSVCIHS